MDLPVAAHRGTTVPPHQPHRPCFQVHPAAPLSSPPPLWTAAPSPTQCFIYSGIFLTAHLVIETLYTIRLKFLSIVSPCFPLLCTVSTADGTWDPHKEQTDVSEVDAPGRATDVGLR